MKLRYKGPFDPVVLPGLLHFENGELVENDLEVMPNHQFEVPDEIGYTAAKGDPRFPVGDPSVPEDEQVPYTPEHGLSLQEDFEVVGEKTSSKKGDDK